MYPVHFVFWAVELDAEASLSSFLRNDQKENASAQVALTRPPALHPMRIMNQQRGLVKGRHQWGRSQGWMTSEASQGREA